MQSFDRVQREDVALKRINVLLLTVTAPAVTQLCKQRLRHNLNVRPFALSGVQMRLS
jgi:hypothetical protein